MVYVYINMWNICGLGWMGIDFIKDPLLSNLANDGDIIIAQGGRCSEMENIGYARVNRIISWVK